MPAWREVTEGLYASYAEWYYARVMFATGTASGQHKVPTKKDGTAGEWKTLAFLAWLYNNAPNKNEVVVNDRFGKDMPGKHGDYYSIPILYKEGRGGLENQIRNNRYLPSCSNTGQYPLQLCVDVQDRTHQ